MNDEQIEHAALSLYAARRDRYQIDALPQDCVPTTVDEAYAVQDRLAEHLDEPIAGWFLGCTNDEALARLQADGPYSARLLRKDLFHSPKQFHADHFFDIWIDCEFAFELAIDLPARDTPYSKTEIKDAVSTVYPAIEVVNGYLKDWQAQPIGAIMADNGTDGALILGPPTAMDSLPQLVNVQVAAHHNGALAEQGSGADVLGDPWTTMTWLANEQSRRGYGLRAGHINNTGSCTKPFRVVAGDQVVVDFGPLGQVHAQF